MRGVDLTLNQGKDSMLNQRWAPGWSSSSSICWITQIITIVSLFFVVPFTTCVLLFRWCRLRRFLRIYFSLTVDFGLVMRTYFPGNQYKLGKLRPACAEAQPDLDLLWRTVSKALLGAAHVLLSRVCVFFFPIAAVYSPYFSHSMLSLIQKSLFEFYLFVWILFIRKIFAML